MSDLNKVLVIVIIVILAFVLQMYVLNDLTLWGTKANIFLVVVVALSIWVKPNITIPFVFVIGLFSDLIFTYTIGRGLVTYLVIMTLIMYTSKFYNKQNIGVVIAIMAVATIITEDIFWIFDGIKYSNFQNIFSVFGMSLKQMVLNVLLQVLCIKIFSKLSEK